MLEILEGVGRVLRLPVSLHSKFLRFETQARAGWNQESESGWVELLGWKKKRVGKNTFFANLVPISTTDTYYVGNKCNEMYQGDSCADLCPGFWKL